MGKLHKFLLLSFGFILLYISREAGATLVVPRDLSDLSKTAPLVVHGKVAQISENPVDGRRFAEIEVLDLARSPEEFRGQKLFIVPLENRVLPGNEVAEIVSGAPEFSVGEELVLFLRPQTQGREFQPIRRLSDGQILFSIEGFFQGKFLVAQDRLGVRRLMAWNQGAKSKGFDAQSVIQNRVQKTSLKKQPSQNQTQAKLLQIEVSKEQDYPLLTEVLESVRGAQ